MAHFRRRFRNDRHPLDSAFFDELPTSSDLPPINSDSDLGWQTVPAVHENPPPAHRRQNAPPARTRSSPFAPSHPPGHAASHGQRIVPLLSGWFSGGALPLDRARRCPAFPTGAPQDRWPRLQRVHRARTGRRKRHPQMQPVWGCCGNDQCGGPFSARTSHR